MFLSKTRRARDTAIALRRIVIAETGGEGDYLIADNIEAILGLVQMSVLEIHTWGSRSDRLEQPDRVVFDLDPDPSVPWERVVAAAQTLRKFLEELGAQTFVKTTGGKGLHIVMPLSPRRAEWPEVKAFAHRVADEMVAREPERYIAKMSKAARKGKIYIDYMRNERGSTFVAPYSTRGKATAPVSTPLAWDELSPSIQSNHYNVGNILCRLEALSSDPWENISKVKQSLPKL